MKSLDREFIELQKQMRRIERMSEKQIAKNYKKTLDDLRKSISNLYEKHEINGKLTMEEMTKYNRLEKLDKEVNKMVSGLYKDNNKIIRGTLQGITKDTYINTIGIVEKARGGTLKGISKTLDVAKTVNTDMAGLTWLERMGHHRGTAIWDIQKEIKQGLKEGDTYGTMAKRLKKKLGTDINKANTIIRTEGHRVHGQAKEDSFDEIEKAGVVFREKWLTAQDEVVRTSHQALDGVIIERGEMFVSPSGAEGPGPGLMGSAEDDIRCRCIKVLILE